MGAIFREESSTQIGARTGIRYKDVYKILHNIATFTGIKKGRRKYYIYLNVKYY